MAYADISMLQQDPDFQRRVMACYAVETLSIDAGPDPASWQAQNSWDMAAQPGFGEAYASALAADPPVERPGNDPGVITDGMILSAVQGLIAPPPVVNPEEGEGDTP